MVIALMGLTSSLMSRSRTRYQPEPNPVQPISCPPTRPAVDTLACHWNAGAPRRLHASANELASEPCRDAPVDQATAIPAISPSPLPHLDRCAAAYREEYGGNEYGGLPVNYAVTVMPNGFHHRARPRNAIIARSISTSCSAVSRPTRVWTFDLLTVVSLSIITSLS